MNEPTKLIIIYTVILATFLLSMYGFDCYYGNLIHAMDKNSGLIEKYQATQSFSLSGYLGFFLGHVVSRRLKSKEIDQELAQRIKVLLGFTLIFFAPIAAVIYISNGNLFDGVITCGVWVYFCVETYRENKKMKANQ